MEGDSGFKVGDKCWVEMEIICEDLREYRLCCKDYSDYLLDIDKKNLGKIATKKTYEDGLAEAWEIARRIEVPEKDGGLSFDEITKIFGAHNIRDIFRNFTAAEVTAKIAEWEDRVLHVGDIVTDTCGDKNVVTGIGGQKETNSVCILRTDGFATIVCKGELTKTGRTIDVQNILNQISEK